MTELIDSIVAQTILRLPKEVRDKEAPILRQSLEKAAAVLGNPVNDFGWSERVLRRMGEQFCIFRGNKHEDKESKKTDIGRTAKKKGREILGSCE